VSGHLPYGRLFSLDELRTIKSEWGSLTIRYEPTAHPDFPEIYQPDIAGDHGGWLVTTGFGLAQRGDYRAVFTKMGDMGIHTLAFTLHGLREHHDWFVCKSGAFDDLLCATRRGRAFGFSTTWQIYVDNQGIKDVPELIGIAEKESGTLPILSIPYHRVGGRLWHYEKLRPSLSDVKTHRLDTIIDDPDKNPFREAETLTAAAWLETWSRSTDPDEVKHPFEPRSWPPQATWDISLRILRNRKVYLDPICNAPILLGRLSEGRGVLMERIEKLAMPPYASIRPEEIRLASVEMEQLHPNLHSLRNKEISKKLHP
jgi:hypothetical protein